MLSLSSFSLLTFTQLSHTPANEQALAAATRVLAIPQRRTAKHEMRRQAKAVDVFKQT